MSSRQSIVRWFLATTLMSLLGAAAALADDPLVYATIEPAQIYLGESAHLTITNLGDGTNPITLPVVSGLKFEIVSRTREIQIINGTTLPSSSTVMRVTPQIAGIFTIPAVTPKSQPLVLQVNAALSGAYVPRADNRRAAPLPPPILSGGSLPKGVHLTEDGSAYVRLIIPKREMYIGESVPVEIEVGMRSGFVSSLNGLPKLTEDNFTLNNLSHQPERSEKLINGEPFVLFTWRSILSVVKPGTFSLSAEAPLTVKIRTRSKRDALLDDRFGDPFFQNLFGTTVPKDIDVTSPPQELKVLQLPAEGRPDDFHGAIGTFSIVSDISPAKADVGDPMTLRLRITGSGSFDRVDSTMLDHVDQWKTYPPKSSFNTSDPIGFGGMKTFEQPVIASKPGVHTLPALTFSYFDPSTRRYETARSVPLNVTISPSLADSTLTAPQVAANAAASGSLKSPVGLRPDHVDDQARASSLTPLYLQPKFLAIPSFLVLAFAAGWVGVRRRRDEEGRSIKREMAQMEAAARAGNETLFFDSARNSLQRLFAARWHLVPEDVTTAEINARMGADNDVHRLFALADESKYSGRTPDAADFVQWLRIVRDQLTGEKSA
ncbi:MAG TPA: BatD family protein [Steroidobacteraceae bacterium]|nr:BatD family protein [Steroidobacteraceae bacterium]